MTLKHLSLFNYDEAIGGALPAHQEQGIEWLWGHPRGVLADEPGLGKTIQALALVAKLAEERGIPLPTDARVLIVCPPSLGPQWRSEIERWLPGFRCHLHTAQSLRTGRMGRVEPPDIEIVPFTALPANVAGFEAKRFNTVIIDEASELKGGKQRHEAVMAVTEHAKRIVVLTATPMENSLLELFYVLTLLRVKGVPPTYAEWCEKFVVFKEGHDYRDKDPRPIGIKEQNLEELHALVDPYILRRTAMEAGLPLPECRRQTVTVELTPAQQEAYAKADSITDPLRRSKTLQDVCNLVGGHSAKADYVMQWLANNPDRRAIVRTESIDLLNLVANRLDDAGIEYVRLEGKNRAERPKLTETFRGDPSVRVCLGSKVLERGLNLQVCDTLISLGSSWVPAREKQAEGRIRRIGSPFDVVDHITVVTNTDFEAYKSRKVDGKRADVAAVLQAKGSATTSVDPEVIDLLDAFVAVNEDWTMSDIAHVATPGKPIGQVELELRALVMGPFG